ncbi:GxxExxY protein [Verrucomicrobia bacterium LW23]|nr:GxxExxY protein [Verrucomicrobia bacterium LW23]
MDEEHIASRIIQKSYEIHCELGPGLLESVYELVLADELTRQGYYVETQKPISFTYGNRSFVDAYRADLIVENLVLIELKSVEQLLSVHKKQTITYIRLSNIRLGLLINFGAALLKGNVHRLINNHWRPRSHP